MERLPGDGGVPQHLLGQIVEIVQGEGLFVIFHPVGGGLLEVIISPMVEACPTENKARTMSILHSFYCWGSAAVIVLSTLFLKVFGAASWQILAPLWAILPIANGIVFLKTPIAPPIAEGEEGLKPRALF